MKKAHFEKIVWKTTKGNGILLFSANKKLKFRLLNQISGK